MSGLALNFTPRAELGTLANLEAFVKLCRESEVLSAKEQFENNVWTIGYLKGQNKVHRALFTTLEASLEREPAPWLPHPFLDFAKATLVYLHDKRPVTSQCSRIAALRYMEAALRECCKSSRPTAVDEMVLDSAVELAKKHVSIRVAYRIAGQLEYIVEFMRTKGFITLRQRWLHGVKHPQELESRISKEALAARQKKLPSAATLRALGAIFYEAIDTADVLVSSNAGLMLCAPERINELLRLRRNCLVEGDGEYRGKFGLRWSGSKGFDDTVKWLPSEMAPIARQAVENIIKVTTSAQRVAAWYTANPTKLYLHEGAAHLRDIKVLTCEQIGFILWGDETARQPANHWAQITNNLPKQPLGGRHIGFCFEDVESAVLAMLPATFPFMPGAPELLCQNAMAILRTNELHSARATYLCMFSCIDHKSITSHFGTLHDRSSIFERFAYVEDDGSPIELRSHSLRHYLNMLAQTGGMSSTEIAIFSGRKNAKQNRAYDHMTSDEVQAPIRQALQGGFMSELEPAYSPGRELFTRGQFKGLRLTAAHATDHGWCLHNFASEPCQMYRDCINCEEQECIKGETTKEENLRMLKSETEYLLSQAREALREDEYGADTWVKHQSATLERIDALLSILEDPTVPAGARVRFDVSNAPLITTDNAYQVPCPRLREER